MIDIEKEKSLALTASEIATICNFAMQASDDNGFINSYMFERALWVYAAIIIYPKLKDKINESIMEYGELTTWQMLISDGTIDELASGFKEEMDEIAAVGLQWFQDYADYSLSVRGMLNAFQLYSGDILQQGAKQLFDAQNNEDFQRVYDIADEWGMNNKKAPEDRQPMFIADIEA